MPCTVTIDAVCPTTSARATTIHTPRGIIETPCFMPVGTYGSVKASDSGTLAEMGYPVLLANALHLYLRPGLDVIRAMGGLHRFMGWEGHLLTDSGGYQLFSLADLVKIEETGVKFASPVDGSRHELTPGGVMDIQRTLGSDFIMPLDHCPSSTAPREDIEAAVSRTTRWLSEQVDLFRAGDPGGLVTEGFTAAAQPLNAATQSLFGIVQGGTHDDLRLRSLHEITALDIDALAIGGLAVGESQAEMFRVLEVLQPHLPLDKPHYLMGVGFPDDLLGAVSRGMDMFDCVLPTRLGRNTTALTSEGRLNLRASKFKLDPGPLDPACDCRVCREVPRALLCHLVKLKHLSAAILLTHHNLSYYRRMVVEARRALLEARFPAFLDSWLAAYRDPAHAAITEEELGSPYPEVTWKSGG